MAEASQKDGERGFIVIDRRGQEDPEEESSGSEPRAGSEAPAEAAEGRAGERPLAQIDFATFILSLSTSALYHMGLVVDPETNQPGPVSRDLARQTIDTLELLEQKTRGNLDPEEKQLLESLLYELRLRFVEAG